MLQNSELRLENFKYKPLTKDQLTISIDRLTRFKDPETKYLRVFKEIITGNLISPKFKKTDLDTLDYKTLTEIAEFIINESLKSYNIPLQNDYSINQKIFDYETSTFELDENVKQLIKNKINYKVAVQILPQELPKNLKWLKTLEEYNFSDKLSHEAGNLFPIKKLIICEGITEETLLPEFAKLLDYDFCKNGVFVLSAGGKNQVVKTFYKFTQNLKLPIYVLLDSDAGENYNEILPRLRAQDRIHMLKNGEFEDILPVKLIEKTLKDAIANISVTPEYSIDKSQGMVHYLEEFFKTRGVHEFKKAEFAQLIKRNIAGIDDVSDEFRNIINELRAIDVKSL